MTDQSVLANLDRVENGQTRGWIVLPDVEYALGVLYVHGGILHLFTLVDGAIALITTTPVLDAAVSGDGITFTTDTGAWTVHRDTGCGCGSPWRHFSAHQWLAERGLLT